jgi:adenine phosphoribosyltransferase
VSAGAAEQGPHPVGPASATLVAARGALRSLIRDVADFPLPGVLFKDIGPVLASAAGLRAVVAALTELVPATRADKVAGIEARGFLLAAAVGVAAGVGVVPVRKAGKLPGATRRIDYALEYGSATLEVQVDVVQAGERVLIIDDVLATGGTAFAAAALLSGAGADISGLGVLLEIAALGGRGRVAPMDVRPLLVV